MDDFLNKNFIMSYKEYLEEQINKYLTELTPEQQEDKLRELLLEAKLKDQGISSTIAADKDFKKVTVPPKEENIVVAPDMSSMPGYEKIEEDIRESEKLKEMLKLEETQKKVEEPEEILEVSKETTIVEDNDPNTASIYNSKDLPLVKQDLEDLKARSSSERTTEIISEPIEEPNIADVNEEVIEQSPVAEAKTKTLTREITPTSKVMYDTETVLPGQLKF